MLLAGRQAKCSRHAQHQGEIKSIIH
jgi:hypothetical protein